MSLKNGNSSVNSLSSTPIKGRYKEKTFKPYVYFWTDKELSPNIYLTKIDEGPSEVFGFRTICKYLKIYVTGGEYMMGFEGTHNLSVWACDTRRDIWVFETSLPNSLQNHTLCCIDLYFICGIRKHRIIEDAVHRYNLIQKSWCSCPPLPAPLYSAACCVYLDYIFVFGCFILKYKPVGGKQWEIVDNVKIKKNFSVSIAMTHGNSIYVIANTSSDLYRFQPFSEFSNMEHLGKFQLEGKNACIINDSIFHFGCDLCVSKCNLEEYNINTSEFNVLWEIEDDDFRLDNANGYFFLPNYCSWLIS